MKYHQILTNTLLPFFVLLPQWLHAETEIRAVQQQVTGHYIVETAGDYVHFRSNMPIANKQSYQRSVKLYGIHFLHSVASWQFRYSFLTTNGRVGEQAYQSELLFKHDTTTYRRGPRFDLQKGIAVDIADSWMAYESSGTTKVEPQLTERQHAVEAFYAISEAWSFGSRFRYINNRYTVREAFSFSSRSGIQPFWSGNDLASNLYELQAGLAYKKDLSPFSLEFSFLPGVGRINARDLNQRQSTTARFQHADGFSLHTSVGVGMRLAGVTFHMNVFAHRLYGRASKAEYTTMLTYGLPVQQPGADLNLKEGGYEIGIGYAF